MLEQHPDLTVTSPVFAESPGERSLHNDIIHPVHVSESGGKSLEHANIRAVLFRVMDAFKVKMTTELFRFMH
ncbi:MAG: hypothetical protein V3R83_12445 [Gammaproteobacteria bacterium]